MRVKNAILMIIGGSVTAISVVQWFFLFPDPSQLMLGVLLGNLFIGMSMYGKHLSYLLEKVQSMEHRLDSLVYAKKSEEAFKEVRKRVSRIVRTKYVDPFKRRKTTSRKIVRGKKRK